LIDSSKRALPLCFTNQWVNICFVYALHLYGPNVWWFEHVLLCIIWSIVLLIRGRRNCPPSTRPTLSWKKCLMCGINAHCMAKWMRFPKYKGHTHTHTPQHVLIPTTHVVCSSLIVGSKTTTTTTKSLLPSLLPFDWTRLKRNHPCCYCSMYIFFFFSISHHPRVIHPSFDTNGFHLLWMKS
jgi:hypothetical protein